MLVTYGNVSWLVVWTMIIQNERRFFDTVDYYVELLLFVLVSCKTTPPTTETERTLIKSFNFEDSLQSLSAWMSVLQIPKNGRLTLSADRNNILLMQIKRCGKQNGEGHCFMQMEWTHHWTNHFGWQKRSVCCTMCFVQ